MENSYISFPTKKILIYSLIGNKYYDFNCLDEKVFLSVVSMINLFDIAMFRDSSVDVICGTKTRAAIEFLDSHYSKDSKLVFSLCHFLKKMKDGDKFCILQFEAPGIEKYLAETWIQQFPSDKLLTHYTKRIFSQWEPVSQRYHHYVFGNDGISVFIGDNSKRRICRFCGKSEPEVQFKKKNAHAIPEALGNKLIFSNEECKDCNERLSVVEKDLVTMMDFRRSMYGINPKGKNKHTDCIGEDFVIKWDENDKMSVYVKQSVFDKSQLVDGERILTVHHHEKLTHNNIYKALVKMVIDVLPSYELSHFNQTIDWINGRLFQDASPDYMVSYMSFMFEQPILDIFIRKENTTGPYCTAMFRTCDMIYLFVVPLVDVDGGKYKYTQNLHNHYLFFISNFGGKWEKVDSKEDSYSVPWYNIVYNENVIIEGDDEKVFDRCRRPRNEPYGFIHFPKPDISKIREGNFKLHYCRITPNQNLSDEDLIDTNIELSECYVFLCLQESRITLSTIVEVSSSNMKKHIYSCKFELTFFIQNINEHYCIEDESLTVNGELISYFIERLFRVGEIVVASHRLGTVTERLNIGNISKEYRIHEFFKLVVAIPDKNIPTELMNKIIGRNLR